MRSTFHRYAAAAAILVALGACGVSEPQQRGASEVSQAATEQPRGRINAAVKSAIDAGGLTEALDGDVERLVADSMAQFYQSEAYDLFWSKRSARRFADEVEGSFDRGLFFDDSDADELRVIADRLSHRDPAIRAGADIALSAAFLRFADELSGDVSRYLKSPIDDQKGEPPIGKIYRTAKGGNISEALEMIEPQEAQYAGLKAALKAYREIYSEGGWTAIDAGDAIEPGARDPRLPSIRRRLAAERFAISSADDPASYDERTVEAVKAFQQRHGLEPDGVIGATTLAAMNESVESKIDSIVDNLHRWRTQGPLEDKYVLANIPSFTAEGWDRGRREISMRTIVGRPDRQTPIFGDKIEYVVANPKWYAPRSIVQADKLPKLRKDPGYLTRGRYDVFDRETGEKVDPFDVDWSDEDAAEKYQLVQAAGEQNALGELKIMFPNQYSVYLHGTPDVSLFEKAQRTFSSGCVRLEDPAAMAQWLARKDGAISPAEIRDAVDSGENTHIALEKQIPVHITYYTVTTDERGEVYFWRDVYKKEDGVQYAKKASPFRTAKIDSAEG